MRNTILVSFLPFIIMFNLDKAVLKPLPFAFKGLETEF
jgi:hypothetical protein